MINTIDVGETSEDVMHFNAIRIRVNGAGNLKLTFYSLDNVNSQSTAVIAMATNTAIEPRVLANFKSQRAFLKIETTEINEIFKINRIIVFAKKLWTEYPG